MTRSRKTANKAIASERVRPPARATRTQQRYWAHLVIAGLSSALGVGSGAALAHFLGSSLEPAGPHEISTVGRIELIRMPIGARRLRDIKTFVLNVGGPDDFGRVYVNNYLNISNEARDAVFFTSSPMGKEARDKVIEKAVDRAEFNIGVKEVRKLLRQGKNYITLELENAIAACVTSIDITVNGKELEHFPQDPPDGYYIEKDVSNLPLLKKFEAASTLDATTTKVGISPLTDALCARRIWEFTLE